MSTVMKEAITDEWPRRHRITADEYHRMAEEGILPPDARVELIEGEIIDMPPIGCLHATVVDELARLFVHVVGKRAIVRVRGAVRLSDRTEPQPDLALLKPQREKYRKNHPAGPEIFLIIEVSDTTFRFDRDTKMELYARYGGPEAWIVDVKSKRLHFFRSPLKGKYSEVSSTARLGVTPVPALPGVTVDLSQLFN
jgi:Uma2 family endonuclease